MTYIGKGAIIEPGAQIFEACVIGENSIVGANAVLRPYTVIGNNSIFGTLSCSEGDCTIGNYTTIHAQCHITKGVHIGNRCFIAPFFIATNTPTITEGKHGVSKSKPVIKETFIHDNVRIGANVRMIPGLTIGRYALIDQDTFLTHNVAPYSHVRGDSPNIGRQYFDV
jgi:acetyltransferase-like isoleucine patch superfamily enzyme